jgi:hypothetical protein
MSHDLSTGSLCAEILNFWKEQWIRTWSSSKKSKFQTSAAMIHKTKEAQQKKSKNAEAKKCFFYTQSKKGTSLPPNKKGAFHPESNRGRPCIILNHTNYTIYLPWILLFWTCSWPTFFFFGIKTHFSRHWLAPLTQCYCHTTLHVLAHVFVPQASRCDELAQRKWRKFHSQTYYSELSWCRTDIIIIAFGTRYG